MKQKYWLWLILLIGAYLVYRNYKPTGAITGGIVPADRGRALAEK
jgi:hypothetical protein